MVYLAAGTCLGWVLTTCLFGWLLAKREESARIERDGLRGELSNARADLTTLAKDHSDQLERISEAHRKEVGNLCQRIQAPEIAVAEHVGQNTLRDPVSVDIENDEVLAEIQRRENDLRLLEQSIHERAEELAAER